MPVVFAAGNSNLDCPLGTPILCINSDEGAITVGAVDQHGNPQDYSSRGPGQCSEWHPFIAAPTYGILPWGPGFRDFGPRGGGTSSATPQVTGALAVLKSMYPRADNTALRVALALGAQSDPGIDFSPEKGVGILQVDRALDAMRTARLHPLYQFLAQRFRVQALPRKLARRVNPSAH